MTHLSDILNSLNKNNYSTRQIAKLAEERGHPINHATVARYLGGKHPNPPRREALASLAAALGTDIANLESASGIAVSRTPFELPPKAAVLTDAERAAIVHLIDVMVASKEPQGMPGTVEYEVEKFLKEKEKAKHATADDMWEHIGKPTPDGDQFRPDLYEDHRYIWEIYGSDWYRSYYDIAAKRKEKSHPTKRKPISPDV